MSNIQVRDTEGKLINKLREIESVEAPGREFVMADALRNVINKYYSIIKSSNKNNQ